ncbi:MAG: phosphate ABC transporter permease PstA [Sterolibacterium sp.]
MNLRQQRKLINRMALSLAMLAMAFGLFWLFWILLTTIDLGFASLSVKLFTQMTPAPGSEGGLLNAIVGSLLLVSLGTLLGTPIGIMAGIYLAEYGRHSWLGHLVSFINDIMLSAPSIIIGLFVYAIYVAQVGHFSGYSGVVAIAILVIPVVVSATANMLKLVPDSLREAVFALGAPKWIVISRITVRASLAGILTGVLLAVARVSGETAPLLFTALSNQFWTLDMNQPIANLPVTIFKFAMSPYKDWQELAWGGVFLITLGVLSLNILARILFRQKHRS